MNKKDYTIIFNNNKVSLNDLIKNGYRFVLKDGTTYINIQDGYVIRRPLKNHNLTYVKEFVSLCEIKDLVRAVYDIHGQLIYKKNKYSGQLNSLTFVPKKTYKQKLKKRKFETS